MKRRALGPSSVQAEPPLAPDSIPVTRYAAAVRRHLPALLVAVLLGCVLGVGKVVLTPASYTASVSVLAPPVSLHPGVRAGSAETEARRPRDATMDTEAQLVWSDEVLRRLSTFPGYRGVPRDELRDRIGLAVPNQTKVLTISVRAPSPATAQNGAQVVAEAYLELRQQILGGVQQRNREGLERQLDQLNQRLKALPGDDSVRLTVRTRRQAIMKQIGTVQKELSAQDSKQVQPGEVLRTAQRPTGRDDPGRDVAVAGGIGVGLLLWVAFVLLRDRRPRRIRRPADVRLHARLPIMVEAPAYDGGHREVCRRLRNLVFDAEATTVLVAGVPGSAGTELAYELAELCTEGGSPATVLQVRGDGDDGDPVPEGTRRPRSFTVRVVRSDDDRQLARAVDKAGRESRIVVITTPDINGADTISAAVASDMTLVVVQRGLALDRDVARGVLALDQAATPARGIVLTAPGRG
ncbi:hypothetical protein [Spirillospora albida]|uniref:hypothetical protein n=1 Tax=Spirillospora albida TaxID=58123 RepID=UPI0004BF1FE8|nr:hypothetical protein [Spirillospora albida]